MPAAWIPLRAGTSAGPAMTARAGAGIALLSSVSSNSARYEKQPFPHRMPVRQRLQPGRAAGESCGGVYPESALGSPSELAGLKIARSQPATSRQQIGNLRFVEYSLAPVRNT
jgi:hypothetical protein